MVKKKVWTCKGSTVIEMAYLMPVVLLTWMLVIFALFYYHDKNILSGAAYESAVVVSELWNESEEEKRSKAEAYFQSRIKQKLLFFGGAQMTCEITDEMVKISARAQKRRMTLEVEESAAVTDPVEKIRTQRLLKEGMEDIFNDN